MFFFFKQKTAYEMRISHWSSDVCSSDLDGDLDRSAIIHPLPEFQHPLDINVRRQIETRNRLFRFNEPPGDRATHPVKLDFREGRVRIKCLDLIKLGAGRERRRCGGGNLENRRLRVADVVGDYPSIGTGSGRSEEHTSELQSLMRKS